MDNLQIRVTWQQGGLPSPPPPSHVDFRDQLVSVGRIRRLARQPEVTRVTIRQTVEPEVICALSEVPGLISLDLAGHLSTERGRALARLPRLVNLGLGHCDVSLAVMKALANASQLESLDLEGCKLTAARVKALAKLERLRSLALRSNFLGRDAPTVEILEALSSLPALTNLSLFWPDMTARRLRYLQYLSNLRSLYMWSGGHTAVLGIFKQLGVLRQLTRLSLRNCLKLNLEMFKELTKLQQLQDLRLLNCDDLTVEMLEQLQDLSELRCLEFFGGKPLSRDKFAALRRLPINSLRLMDCELTMDDIRDGLVGMPVTHMDMGLTRLTIPMVEAIAGLESLRYLDLADADFADDGMMGCLQTKFPDAQFIIAA